MIIFPIIWKFRLSVQDHENFEISGKLIALWCIAVVPNIGPSNLCECFFQGLYNTNLCVTDTKGLAFKASKHNKS